GSAALHRALQPAAGRESRHAGGGDLNRLAGAWIDASACTAIADMELAESRYRHLAAATQGVLHGGQHRVQRPAGILLCQTGSISHLVDKLGLRHFALLVREIVNS